MRFIFITTFLVLQVSFCFSQGESYSSNNYIKMKVKYNDSEFSLYKEGKKTSVYAISFYSIFQLVILRHGIVFSMPRKIYLYIS
jgi:hypothetical protein